MENAMKNSPSCIQACLLCLVACERFIIESVKYGNQECILLCRDCADICALYAKFDARYSDYGWKLHELCSEICIACSLECAKHGSNHNCYKYCAQACEKCAAICYELS